MSPDESEVQSPHVSPGGNGPVGVRARQDIVLDRTRRSGPLTVDPLPALIEEQRGIARAGVELGDVRCQTQRGSRCTRDPRQCDRGRASADCRSRVSLDAEIGAPGASGLTGGGRQTLARGIGADEATQIAGDARRARDKEAHGRSARRRRRIVVTARAEQRQRHDEQFFHGHLESGGHALRAPSAAARAIRQIDEFDVAERTSAFRARKTLSANGTSPSVCVPALSAFLLFRCRAFMLLYAPTLSAEVSYATRQARLGSSICRLTLTTFASGQGKNEVWAIDQSNSGGTIFGGTLVSPSVHVASRSESVHVYLHVSTGPHLPVSAS